MSFADLIVSRFTFGPRFGDAQPVTAATLDSWLAGQWSAPTAEDPAVQQRLAKVTLPITITATDGTSTTTQRSLDSLTMTAAQLWEIPEADKSANRAESRRVVDEVAAARWIRAGFSPWQVLEVMVDFWHNHFSVDAYQSDVIACMWPVFDGLLRANALGNFRTMLGAVAKSVSMMYYLNQNASVASHPNENFAREVMELHTLGINAYLGETTPAGAAGTGYSDQDVINAARVLTGWTIADGHHRAADGSTPDTGDFLFSPSLHDTKSKVIFGQTTPAGGGQAEGEQLLDRLAAHPGTALHIAMKLYTRFVADSASPTNPLVQTLASVFQQNVTAPNQIALMLQALVAAPEFSASAGLKVKTPFEFLISAMRATGADINPQMNLSWILSAMGAPLFHWPTPNGMPDVATVWTGTNDMIQRWSQVGWVMSTSSKLLPDSAGTVFAAAAAQVHGAGDAVNALVPAFLGTNASSTTLAALSAYAASTEVLGGTGVLTNPTLLGAALRRLAGAIAAAPEFQIR